MSLDFVWNPDCGGDWVLSGPHFFANYWPDNTVIASMWDGQTEVANSGIVQRRTRAECQAFAEQWIRDQLAAAGKEGS